MTGRYAAGLAVLALLASGCQIGGDDDPAARSSSPSRSPSGSGAAPASPDEAKATTSPDDPALDVAVSSPRQDPVYPQVGNPVVDALHYDLDLTWDATADRLSGHETLLFRAAQGSPTIPLDLSRALTVTTVTLDGEDVDFVQRDQDLIVKHAVDSDDRHTLVLDYSGTPEPVAAPTTRSDFSTNGWTITDSHETWTMQEPYGALTWYAVNDQPADKALYDFTIHAPSPMVGVANGQLVSRTTSHGTTTTAWHLADPASSYLVTLAIGRFQTFTGTSGSGVPLQVWAPADRPAIGRVVLRSARAGMAWIEDRLGPYPFDSLGVLLVDSYSGMETQTMITLGAPNGYTTSPEVVVHEMVHQWYGDQVTPTSWRDMWMNEGMAMYLQLAWQADHGQGSIASQLDRAGRFVLRSLRDDGPPADYDPTAFGESNVYYVPAMMWGALRTRLGDAEFWRLVKAWPRSHDGGGADYATITRWWSRQTGQDLRPFFDSWLRSSTLPAAVNPPPPHRHQKHVTPGSGPGTV